LRDRQRETCRKDFLNNSSNEVPQPGGRMRAFLGHAFSDELQPPSAYSSLHRERRCRVLLLGLDVEIGGEATHLWVDANEWIATESPTLTDKIQPCFGHLNDDTRKSRPKRIDHCASHRPVETELVFPQLKNPVTKILRTPVLIQTKQAFSVGVSGQSQHLAHTQVHQEIPRHVLATLSSRDAGEFGVTLFLRHWTSAVLAVSLQRWCAQRSIN